MDRRKFLLSAGYAVGAGLAIPSELIAYKPDTCEFSLDNWTDVRNQFPLEKGKIHMAQMLLVSHPKPVQTAIDSYREKFNANPAEYWENNFQAAEPRVIAAASEYLECKSGEVALTDSTTQGLGTLYSGLKLSADDEILTTTHDHYSTEKALEYAAAKNGASIRRISLYNDPSKASVDEIVSRLEKAVSPKTKVVAVTWVHSCTGVKLPIREMADAIKTFNSQRGQADRIYLAVDGVHGFGVEDITMESLGCDFFVAGTHKWLFGPRGTGIIWAKEDAWDMVVPTIPPFSIAYAVWLGLESPDILTFSDIMSPGGFHAFEHRWALDTAFDFHQRIGKAKIERRTHQLNSLLKEGLKDTSHVKLHTPISEELSSGINCFEIDGMTEVEVVHKLHEQNIVASTSPYPVSYARLTPCITNTEEEVMTCIKAVEEL